MKRVRYSVAMSLDGYIAGPDGEYDWILMDPDIDMSAILAEFDTILMGRKTYQVTTTPGEVGTMHGMDTYVFSRTLRQDDCPGVTVVPDRPGELVADLKEKPGQDIWLFGGGSLFHSLLDLGLVDSVEVAIIPMLLGDGVPLLHPPATRAPLELVKHDVYAKTGTTILQYAVS